MFTYNPIFTLIILVIFGCQFRILTYTLKYPYIPLISLNTLMGHSNDTYAVVGTRPKNDLLVGNVDACVSGVGCVAHRKQIYSTIALSEPGNLKRLFN